MDIDLKTKNFLEYFNKQPELGLVIIENKENILDLKDTLDKSGFKEVLNELEILNNLNEGFSLYTTLSSSISKEMYDLIAQYNSRLGMIQIMDKTTMNLRSIEFDPNNTHLVLVVSGNDLEEIQKQFNILDKVGLTERM